jgi:NAD-dependent SIR2 family protein deacetylase
MLLSHFLFIFSQRYATILLDYYRRLYYVIKPFPLYFQPTLCHYFIRLLQEKGILLRHYTQVSIIVVQLRIKCIFL